MLNDIIFQVILSALGVSLVNSEKFKRLQKLKGAVYVAILSFLLFKGVPWNRENYYLYLNVTPNATKQEIHTAYRRSAKIYHPDKKTDMSADNSFIKLKMVYDVLTDDVRRSYYNRFGDYKNGEVDESTATILICLSLVQQTLLFIIGYFLSYSKKSRFSRQIFLVYNIASFCFELQFRFIEDDTTFDWVPYFGYFLPFEKIMLLRSLFPVVFFISLCMSHYIYTDQNKTLMFMLHSILSTNRVIVERVNDVMESTDYLKTDGAQLVARLQQLRQNSTGKPSLINLVQEKKTDEETDEETGGNKDRTGKREEGNENAQGKEEDTNSKLMDNLQKLSITLDSQQMKLLQNCLELMKSKDMKESSKMKKAWYENISVQMVFAIICVYVWLTTK